MKNATPFAFVFASLLFANACQNKTQGNKADTQQAIKPVIEKVDTPDCALLTTMHPIDHYTWGIYLKDNFKIINDSKPVLEIKLRKTTPDPYFFENLMWVLIIDTEICVDKYSSVTFTYANNSTTTLENFEDNNCSGNFTLPIIDTVGADMVRHILNPNVAKMRDNKIKSIRFETHNGGRVYTLTDIQATELQYLINCIHKAK